MRFLRWYQSDEVESQQVHQHWIIVREGFDVLAIRGCDLELFHGYPEKFCLT
jgi:hypothetical protein